MRVKIGLTEALRDLSILESELCDILADKKINGLNIKNFLRLEEKKAELTSLLVNTSNLDDENNKLDSAFQAISNLIEEIELEIEPLDKKIDFKSYHNTHMIVINGIEFSALNT